jgi:two-component system, NarL family, sensor histidine kinase FusK
MRSYWLWLLFNLIVWLPALLYFNQGLEEITSRLLGASLFFVVFFFLSLAERKPKILLGLLCTNALISFITLFPVENGEFNIYLILVFTLLIGKGFYSLPLKYSLLLGVILASSLIATVLRTEQLPFIQIFIILYFLSLLVAMLIYKNTKNENDDLNARHQALLSEYRDIKRRLASNVEYARQEERTLIGHEIHDSVGHKLTALLMQLEVFRLKASAKDKEQVQFLKNLANDSLEETRSAVKMLKNNETGGLPGVLRLIRKLELESFLRIHFSVKHGAFSAPLTGEQWFIIYRSVQEALTNIMKHSNSREAEILFESPGRSIFRFEISNPVVDNKKYTEGFGLSSMRERLQKFGGNLDLIKTEERFIIRGFLKINDWGDNVDTNSFSRRPGNGETGSKDDD